MIDCHLCSIDGIVILEYEDEQYCPECDGTSLLCADCYESPFDCRCNPGE